jgi:hypothetical protein
MFAIGAVFGVVESQIGCSGQMVYAEGLFDVIYTKFAEFNHCRIIWLGRYQALGYLTGIIWGIVCSSLYYFRTPLMRSLRSILSKGNL